MASRSESEGEEGEELGIIRATLIRELRNVLDEYPDDGQILKEMIQNAEDAGASTMKFVSDTREFNRNVSPADIRNNPHLKFLKGPALYAFNNAMFSDRDWQGIRMIHTSIKEADPLKVGRFGLGFKSVFHMTDRLTIISGNCLLYMDPFKGEDRCCILKKLSRIKKSERESLLEGLGEIFGVGEEMFHSGHYPGTMFWFPLRNEASDLSSTLYSVDKINDLWKAFKTEASGIPLFLKRIESVGLYTRRQDKHLSLDFQVALATSCLESVRRENMTFIEAIMAAGGQIPAPEVWNSLIKEVEMSDDHNGQSVVQREKWLVVNYHPGQSDLSPELAELCKDPQLCYKPYVGLAAPLKGQKNFQSQIFCFLPLPLESRSPTGLPVHVNGFFALSQNRRHLKWPTADQLSHQAHMEPSLRWNQLLVQQLLPPCYALLLTRLREQHVKTPLPFYTMWPDINSVTDKWQPLVGPLFVTMATKPVYYTECGQWVELANALLSTITDDLSTDLKRTVHKVYVTCQENLIVLPQNVLKGLSLSGCLSTVAITTPQRLSRLLQSCMSQFEGQERCHLLAYLCDQKDFSLLEGLQLLPLQDGSFGAFTTEPSPTFFCQDCDIRLFPGLETHFCSCELPHDLRQHLHDIAVSGIYSLKLMAKTDVCHLLMKSIQCRFGQQEPIVSLDDQWLQDVWHFLLNNCSDNLRDFSLMPLIPFLHDNSFVLKPLVGNYVCKEVSGMDPVSDNLVTCLRKLGITVLSHLPDYVIRHPQVLGQLVQWPSPQGLLLLLSHISEDDSTQTVLSFNGSSTDEDQACLIKLLDDCRDIVLNINLQKLLQQLNLFSCLPDRTITSIASVRAIAPEHLPPVPVPRQMLVCQESRDRRVALQLGGQVESLQDISREILLNMQPGREGYSLELKHEFMKFFMDELLNNKSLCQLARRVKFLTTSSNQLKAVEDLYDPSHKLLKEVFSDDAFPHGEDDFIDKLRQLGLKDESQVTSEEFLQVAELLNASHDHPASIRRAQSLWTLLTSQISRLDSRARHELSHFRCLPALHAKSMPDSYPCELPAASPEPVLVSPRDVYPYQYLALVGSVASVADEKLSSHELIQELFNQEVPVETVLKHLTNITKFYNTRNCFQFRTQLNSIYSYFDKNKENETFLMALSETPCLLVENETVFLKPASFWIEDNIDDVVLRPYRYRMSQETTTWQTLFIACGTRTRQDASLLLEVLSEIQAKHLHKSSQREINRDLKLVVQILETLKDYPPEERRDIILPIAHREGKALRFRPAVECTVGDIKWLMEAESQCSEDEEVVFVHPKLPVSTALALGALGIMDRALDETEDINYDYYQDEPLTTRLHNLLEDSYTDGFSIPKELIQNADDAGARQVKFLLDERQNEDCREHLIHPNMASLQGPALWVFNDATFSDQDFANIIKLGAGTKRDDASKVGKFGLGFNAVYNLSDVPSFISRNTMALFDPHKRHLPRGNPGMKIDLSMPKNRSLLRSVPSQFRPFEGVFGCSLKQEPFVEYPATLFRLPFRSEEQAALSDIKKESYSPEKRRQFMAMLIKKAGNLLLFTQNVKSVEVFHLSRDEKSPFNMTCLMSVTRESAMSAQGPHHVLTDPTESILKVFSRQFQNFLQTGMGPPDIRFAEQVSIVMDVRSEAKPVCDVQQCLSQTEWRITWASGVNQSARLAFANKDQGFLPLASAAVLVKDKTILSMNNCPFGFYQEGHLFCFLPLPEQMEQPVLPVHLNGTFALTSSRRNLLITTEENIDNKGGNWNSALVSDAVCRAYLLLLESLQDIVDVDYSSYYELWPKSENGLSLVDSFYTCLINGNCSVFPSHTRWVSFDEATFFDPVFRFSQVGELALRTVLELKKDQIMLVDIPMEIAETFGKTRNRNAFVEKCLSEDFFYEHIFFPSIVSDFWKTPDKVRVRDTLTLHAIIKGSNHVKRLVSTFPCIPCDVSHELKTPDELVHPFCDAAALFLPADGRFPQTGSEQGAVDFCQSECLMRLTELGMTDNDLQWKDVIRRANSVKDLFTIDTNLAFSRAVNIVDYLALTSSSTKTLRILQYSPDEAEQLSQTEFLPVLTKPCDWPFPWFEDDLQPRLAAPCQLYHSRLTNLVACTQKLLDDFSTSSLRLKTTEESRRAVHASLKIVTQELPTHEDTVKSAVDQLLIVAKFRESHQEIRTVTQKTNKLCCAVYSFLQMCIESNEVVKKQELIENPLKTERIIWTGSYFYHPAKLAFMVKLACPPYLQEISGTSEFKVLFQFLGVRERFGIQDMLGVMEEMKQDVGDKQLSVDQVELFCRAAQLFCFARQETQDVHSLDPNKVSLPDKEGFLRCVSNLCMDDSSSLRLKPGMHFIHDKFSPEVAKTLGVKSKNSTIFKSHMTVKRFGQSEKLTNRIKRLLQGYTCDVSIFKEFIQNADDAGATEIRFIKDFRQLGTDSVPDGWKELQGPALCVYNNADFTSKDIAGIQNLGEGSKGEEMMKTGQFGVGFNAVYHITDVPSFWTRRDGKEQVICVCDPCVLIPNEWQEPGMELEDIDSLKEEYPALVDGYLLNTFDVSQPATLFRLPLRTKWMAAKSAIKKEPMTEYNVSSLLTDFLKDASLCLLFLNNLQKIGIYSTKDGHNIEREYEIEMVIDKSNALRKEAFREILSGESEMMIDEDLSSGIVEMKSSETIVNFSLKDSHGVQEDWIQVSRAGFLDASKAPEKLQDDWRKEHFRLLPRGGVAVKIKTTQPSAADTPTIFQSGVGKVLSKEENIQSRVFCTLPLPVKTDLPVHINGHFALEHESRRNLWDREDDSRTMWNKLLCTDVIAPSYVKALEQVRFAWFKQKQHEDKTSTETAAQISQFFALFPSISQTESSFWSPLVEAFYQQVINGRQALFPVTRADTGSVTWTSIIKDKGFAGYFTRPPQYTSPVSPCYSLTFQENEKERVSDRKLAELLKCLNMKIVDAPLHVFTALKYYGVHKIQEATLSAVLLFLKSCTATTSDSCQLKNLPQPLADIGLDEKDVLTLVTFVKKSSNFPSDIIGLPLCLRQSGILDIFSIERKAFVTPFCDLFPMLSEEFLHVSLVEIFSRVADEVSSLLSFTIQHLAERLPRCLDQTLFKTGQPRLLSAAALPSENWLHRLWKFIAKKVNNYSSVDHLLWVINEWSLIPCKVAGNEECLLYPIKEGKRIFCLPRVPCSFWSHENEAVNVLQKLPLPIIDQSVVSQSFAEKLVASVANPDSIVHLLRSFGNSLQLTVDDARSMLNYFNFWLKKLSHFGSSCYLREIPMFCSFGGRVTSLDSQNAVLLLDQDIPQDGLQVWSEETNTVLLDPWLIPDALCEILHLNKSSNLHMIFWRRLLSHLEYLPHDCVHTHIRYIRENYVERCKNSKTRKALYEILSETAFIRTEPDRMCKASEFYSPHNVVFREMHDVDKFPPEPYCDGEWRDFMEKAGMVKEVTVEMFISFARQVAVEGANALSEKTLTRSSTLVQHLFERDDLWDSELLSSVCDISFVRPWSFKQTERYQGLEKICPPFVVNRLVSFSESCLSSNWPLLWSSTSILHPDDEPNRFYLNNLKEVVKELDFEQNIPVEYFKQHVVNVCQALHTSTCNILHTSEGRREVEWLFDKIYEFLAKFEPEEMDFFKNIPVVFDSYNSRVLYPEQVVFVLRSDQAVDGWLFRAPANYDQFRGLFKVLGVSINVTADHYVRVLTKLHAAYPSEPLQGDMLQACKKAVQGLFRCLKVSPDLKEKMIYLPNEQFCLKLSSSLFFVDNERLKTRLQCCLEKFFSGFKQLDIHCVSPWGTVSLLPEGHRMAKLSEITTEVVPDMILSAKTVGFLAHDFKSKLLSVDLVNGITRLIYHKHLTSDIPPVETNIRQEVRELLASIEIFETEDLHTVLVVNEEQVTDSEAKYKIVRDKRFPRCVFVDSRASVSDEDVDMTLADAAIETVGHDLHEFRFLLIFMLKSRDVQALLDKHNISSSPRGQTIKPGCYVNVDDFCLLDNSVERVYVSDENVVLEVYDPLTDSEDIEREEQEMSVQVEECATPCFEESMKRLERLTDDMKGMSSHQVFLYARVIERICVGQEQHIARPCCMSYRVDIGNKRTMAVSAVKLYKIPTTFEDEPSDATATSSSQPVQSDPMSVTSIVKQVKGCLKASLPIVGDERLQLGLLKRLYLQWHPDLNTTEQKDYSRILKVIRQSALNKRSSKSTALFFNRVLARGQLYASQIDGARGRESNLGIQSKRKNPQPGEANRWLRQAFEDLKMAKNCSEGNNWLCLIYHQAAEKALKALLFYKNADDKLLHPVEKQELKILAKATDNKDILQAAEHLEGLTGERWRMSYPFVQWGPQLPAHLYTKDMAQSSYSQTETILTMAASLMV